MQIETISPQEIVLSERADALAALEELEAIPATDQGVVWSTDDRLVGLVDHETREPMMAGEAARRVRIALDRGDALLNGDVIA